MRGVGGQGDEHNAIAPSLPSFPSGSPPDPRGSLGHGSRGRQRENDGVRELVFRVSAAVAMFPAWLLFVPNVISATFYHVLAQCSLCWHRRLLILVVFRHAAFDRSSMLCKVPSYKRPRWNGRLLKGVGLCYFKLSDLDGTAETLRRPRCHRVGELRRSRRHRHHVPSEAGPLPQARVSRGGVKTTGCCCKASRVQRHRGKTPLYRAKFSIYRH